MFDKPKANVLVSIVTPIAHESPESTVATQLFVSMVKEQVGVGGWVCGGGVGGCTLSTRSTRARRRVEASSRRRGSRALGRSVSTAAPSVKTRWPCSHATARCVGVCVARVGVRCGCFAYVPCNEF